MKILPYVTELEIRKLARENFKKRLVEELRRAKSLKEAGGFDSIAREVDEDLPTINVAIEEKEEEAMDALVEFAKVAQGAAISQYLLIARSPTVMGPLHDEVSGLTTFPVNAQEFLDLYTLLGALMTMDQADMRYTRTLAAIYGETNESLGEFLVNTMNPLEPMNLVSLALAPFTGGLSLVGGAAVKAGSRLGRQATKSVVKDMAMGSYKSAMKQTAKGQTKKQVRSTLGKRFAGDAAEEMITPTGLKKFTRVPGNFEPKTVKRLKSTFNPRRNSDVFDNLDRVIKDGIDDPDIYPDIVDIDSFDDLMEVMSDETFLKKVLKITDPDVIDDLADNMATNIPFKKNMKQYYEGVLSAQSKYKNSMIPFAETMAGSNSRFLSMLAKTGGFIEYGGQKAIKGVSHFIDGVVKIVTVPARKLGADIGADGVGMVKRMPGLSKQSGRKIVGDIANADEVMDVVRREMRDNVRSESPVAKLLSPGERAATGGKMTAKQSEEVTKRFRGVLEELDVTDPDDLLQIVTSPVQHGQIRGVLVDQKLLDGMGLNPSDVAGKLGDFDIIEATPGEWFLSSAKQSKADIAELTSDITHFKNMMRSQKSHYDRVMDVMDSELLPAVQDASEKHLIRKYIRNSLILRGPVYQGLIEGNSGHYNLSDDEVMAAAAMADAASVEAENNKKENEQAFELALAGLSDAQPKTQEELDQMEAADEAERDAPTDETYLSGKERAKHDDLNSEWLATQSADADKAYYDGLVGMISHYDEVTNFMTGRGDKLRRLEKYFTRSSWNDEMATDIDKINFIDLWDTGAESVVTGLGDIWDATIGRAPEMWGGEGSNLGGREAFGMQWTGKQLDLLVNHLAWILKKVSQNKMTKENAKSLIQLTGVEETLSTAMGPGQISKIQAKIKEKMSGSSASQIDVSMLDDSWAAYLSTIEAAKNMTDPALNESVERILSEGIVIQMKINKRNTSKTSNSRARKNVKLSEDLIRKAVKRVLITSKTQDTKSKKKRLNEELTEADRKKSEYFLKLQSQLAKWNGNPKDGHDGVDGFISDGSIWDALCAPYFQKTNEADKHIAAHDFLTTCAGKSYFSHRQDGEAYTVGHLMHVGVWVYKFDLANGKFVQHAAQVNRTPSDWQNAGKKLGVGNKDRDSEVWKAIMDAGPVSELANSRENFRKEWLNQSLTQVVDDLEAKMGPVSSGDRLFPMCGVIFKEEGNDDWAYGPGLNTTLAGSSIVGKVVEAGDANSTTIVQGNAADGLPKMKLGLKLGMHDTVGAYANIFVRGNGDSDKRILDAAWAKKLADLCAGGSLLTSDDATGLGEELPSPSKHGDDTGGFDGISVLVKSPEDARKDFIEFLEDRAGGAGLMVIGGPLKGNRFVNNYVAEFSMAGYIVKHGMIDWIETNAPKLYGGFYTRMERVKGAIVNQSIGDWKNFNKVFKHMLGHAKTNLVGIFEEEDVRDLITWKLTTDTIDDWRKLSPKLVEMGYEQYAPNFDGSTNDLHGMANFLRDLANGTKPHRSGERRVKRKDLEETVLIERYLSKYWNGSDYRVDDMIAYLRDLIEKNPAITDDEINDAIEAQYGDIQTDPPSPKVVPESYTKRQKVLVSRAFKVK